MGMSRFPFSLIRNFLSLDTEYDLRDRKILAFYLF